MTLLFSVLVGVGLSIAGINVVDQPFVFIAIAFPLIILFRMAYEKD